MDGQINHVWETFSLPERRGSTGFIVKGFARAARTIRIVLPVIAPAPLTSVKVHIDHPNWLYELKHDGFRGILYLDRERAWFRSRKSNEMRRFDALGQQIHGLLKGQPRPTAWV